ncbi:Phosphocarrier protein HPr [Chlamydiales bacterium STE3]|nr:Phosphocarrier protein HPr [Chlamydiales bacterium STE3]
MKISAKLIVKNEMGLHARPAAEIVKLLLNSESEVTFILGMMKINAKNILGILMLAAPKNSVITVEIVGHDAKETMEKLKFAFEERFGE